MPRPPQRLLSAEIIVDAALKMIDISGDFTMPGLAERLNVRPSSLYNHVSGRAEIIELMRARAMASIRIDEHGEETGDWVATVAALAREYRLSYSKHPRLIPLLTAHTVQTDIAFGMYNALATAFTAGGFSPAEVLHAITALDSFVLGSALDLAAPQEVWASTPRANEPMRAALAAAGSAPTRADDAFEFGLRVLIAGLRAESSSAP
ncbi:TetR/AcrR family transcriptional regulator C-terminal domain-containing protein [Rhodococcus oryzae]|uniref:TetR/AcrR family transcriptional regulator C-terminal domain-containing protein n=1 Tax=Rhodococcus oryzae TaxID=2571143 RepID=UPI00371CACA1